MKKIILGDFSTDIAFRYVPLLELIKNNRFLDKKILEVGSGSLGIASYLKQEITGLDIFFDERELENLKKVKYSGGAFPFADNFFSLVISVDSLEHVSRDMRAEYVKEMLRVASQAIIIMVPTGKESYAHDKRLSDYFKKINNRSDQYLDEHLKNGLPEKGEIEDYIRRACLSLGKKGEIKINEKSLNIKFRELFMQSKINRNLFLNILYYFFIIFLPFWRWLNWGKCYRTLVYVRIK